MGKESCLARLCKQALEAARLPKPAHLRLASEAEYDALLPHTHPISGYRNRGIAHRGLEVYLQVRAPSCSSSSTAPHAMAPIPMQWRQMVEVVRSSEIQPYGPAYNQNASQMQHPPKMFHAMIICHDVNGLHTPCNAHVYLAA